MSWRDREGGHVVREEADWTTLGKLPKGVALQVHRYESDDLTCYFIATRAIRDMKWPTEDDGFSEFAPQGSQSFRRRVREGVPEFCAAFDLLHRQRPGAESGGGFGPSARVGELSLGFQMAALLGARVLSFISDPDYDAGFACEHTPDGPTRIACVRSFVHLLHDRGRVRAAPLANEGIPRDVVNVLRGRPGVTIARGRSALSGDMHEVVISEIDRFAGREIADPATVVPTGELTPVARRVGNGSVRLLE